MHSNAQTRIAPCCPGPLCMRMRCHVHLLRLPSHTPPMLPCNWCCLCLSVRAVRSLRMPSKQASSTSSGSSINLPPHAAGAAAFVALHAFFTRTPGPFFLLFLQRVLFFAAVCLLLNCARSNDETSHTTSFSIQNLSVSYELLTRGKLRKQAISKSACNTFTLQLRAEIKRSTAADGVLLFAGLCRAYACHQLKTCDVVSGGQHTGQSKARYASMCAFKRQLSACACCTPAATRSTRATNRASGMWHATGGPNSSDSDSNLPTRPIPTHPTPIMTPTHPILTPTHPTRPPS